MLRKLARQFFKYARSLAQEPTTVKHAADRTGKERVNFQNFAEKVAYYRARGAEIGEKVRLIGELDTINPHLTKIGDYSVIGNRSMLLGHCPIKGALPITIGKFVYIGYGVTVMPGVTLGDGCIVGASSVVTKSVPSGSVVAGNPARVIRSLRGDELEIIKTAMLEERIFGWEVPTKRPA